MANKNPLSFQEFVETFQPRQQHAQYVEAAKFFLTKIKPISKTYSPATKQDLIVHIEARGIGWMATAPDYRRGFEELAMQTRGAVLLWQAYCGKTAHLKTNKPIGRPSRRTVAERAEHLAMMYKDWEKYGRVHGIDAASWADCNPAILRAIRKLSGIPSR